MLKLVKYLFKRIYEWLFWKPKKKSWCVMFYLTSQVPRSSYAINYVDPETGVPVGSLSDAKLDQILNDPIAGIKNLPCATAAGISSNPGWEDVHVVYRAIWDDVSQDVNGNLVKPPVAAVVSPDSSAPSTSIFVGVPGELGVDATLTEDVTAFFNWVYDKCPADHYAIFFWGHAMGPGGLFEAGEKPIVIKPLLKFLLSFVSLFFVSNRWSGPVGVKQIGAALGNVVERRLADRKRQPEGRFDVKAQKRTTPLSTFSPKVDIVVFQSCWLSTLETAFELQDAARYIVASQSLVPTGLIPDPNDNGNLIPGAVWPYKDLISELLSNQVDYPNGVMNVLDHFFNTDGTQLVPAQQVDYTRWPSPMVQFSLLDCGQNMGAVSDALKCPLLCLVKALEPLGKQGRDELIDRGPAAGALTMFDQVTGRLLVGDQALIDVLTFCASVGAFDFTLLSSPITPGQKQAILDAAAAVALAVKSLLARVILCPAPVPPVPVLTGISTLYKPAITVTQDQFIEGISQGDYRLLRFSSETTVNPSPSPPNDHSWTSYAFEQYQ
jgi:cysteine peptidase C11 family protein